MNKKAKQLRELRNKIIYNDNVPLEFGCEIILKNGTQLVIVDGVDNPSIHAILVGDRNYNSYGINRDEIAENLGKPTSWGDVLRMLNKKENELGWYVLESNGRLMFFYDYKDCSAKEILQFDLSKEPEEQDEKVLDKLLELLK